MLPEVERYTAATTVIMMTGVSLSLATESVVHVDGVHCECRDGGNGHCRRVFKLYVDIFHQMMMLIGRSQRLYNIM